MKHADWSKVLLQHRVAEETKQQFNAYCAEWGLRKGDALERAIALLIDPNLSDPELYQQRFDDLLRHMDRLNSELDLLTEFVRAFCLFVMTHLRRVEPLDLREAFGRADASLQEIMAYIARRLASGERLSDALPCSTSRLSNAAPQPRYYPANLGACRYPENRTSCTLADFPRPEPHNRELAGSMFAMCSIR